MKKIIYPGFVVGIILSMLSYGSLYFGIRYFPSLFMDYNNPLFDSHGDRDILFYTHAFVISFALSWFGTALKDYFRALFY